MLELLTKAIGKLLKLKSNTDKSTSTSSKSNSGNSSRRKVLSKEIELQDISGGTTKIEYSLLTREYLVSERKFITYQNNTQKYGFLTTKNILINIIALILKGNLLLLFIA